MWDRAFGKLTALLKLSVIPLKLLQDPCTFSAVKPKTGEVYIYSDSGDQMMIREVCAVRNTTILYHMHNF